MKIAALFPGQGSQFLGMGLEFRQIHTFCQEIMDQAELSSGLALKTLSDDGPMEELTRGAALQPAITAANLICWEAFKNTVGDEFSVDCFAGHSLGEYSALYAAGVLSAEDALKLVSKRGALMEREGDANPGGMRALLGLEIKQVEEIIDAYSGAGVVTAANHNSPQQIVISGSMDALDGVQTMAEEKGAKVIPLNVSVANHSPLVEGAVAEFSAYMAAMDFKTPQMPVYCNVSAAKEQNPGRIKEMMGKQIISRVRWYEIITAMLDDGVDTFIEVGPKTVLKGMMKKIVPKGTKVTTLQFDSPAGLEKCLEKLRG
jgi:[acyl-carrier-protein] S-malonyltransferase